MKPVRFPRVRASPHLILPADWGRLLCRHACGRPSASAAASSLRQPWRTPLGRAHTGDGRDIPVPDHLPRQACVTFLQATFNGTVDLVLAGVPDDRRRSLARGMAQEQAAGSRPLQLRRLLALLALAIARPARRRTLRPAAPRIPVGAIRAQTPCAPHATLALARGRAQRSGSKARTVLLHLAAGHRRGQDRRRGQRFGQHRRWRSPPRPSRKTRTSGIAVGLFGPIIPQKMIRGHERRQSHHRIRRRPSGSRERLPSL